ncbi:DUF6053 domain-containing protein [Lysobacter enzymogenes]
MRGCGQGDALVVVGGPSGPMLFCPTVAIRPKGIGPEGPPAAVFRPAP